MQIEDVNDEMTSHIAVTILENEPCLFLELSYIMYSFCRLQMPDNSKSFLFFYLPHCVFVIQT